MPHPDDRGTFTEVFRNSYADSAESFPQVNLSRSHAGVLRGMHLHLAQTDYWACVDGEMHVALTDTRARYGMRGASNTLTLSSEEPRGLEIPPGVAHGFYATAPVTLLYVVSRYHDGTDERGFHYADPEVGIPWPTDAPKVSKRDEDAEPFSVLCSELDALRALELPLEGTA